MHSSLKPSQQDPVIFYQVNKTTTRMFHLKQHDMIFTLYCSAGIEHIHFINQVHCRLSQKSQP